MSDTLWGDLANLLMPLMGHLLEEHRMVLILNTKHRVKRVEWAYSGSVNTCLIRAGELCRTAVKMRAVAITVGYVGATNGTGSLGVARVIQVLDTQIVAALKQLPVLLGSNEGATITHATVQWQI